MIKVAGNIGKISLAGQFQKVIQTIVKFMIAGNRDVLTGSVHNLYDRFASCQKPHRLSLNSIAIIHQKDVMIL